MAEMSGQGCSKQQSLLIRFDASCAKDDMGTWDILRVQPEIVTRGNMKGQAIVLTVVFPDEDLGAIFGTEAERP